MFAISYLNYVKHYEITSRTFKMLQYWKGETFEPPDRQVTDRLTVDV